MAPKTKRKRRYTRKQKGGNKKTVVFTITQKAGFGSGFAFLLEAYIYAKKHGYDFKIKNNNWQYGSEKGWHTFFNSLDAYNSSKLYEGQENYEHSKSPNGKYTFKDYHDALINVYKPNELILNKAKEFIKTIGGNYVAIYIRRGDKTFGSIKEMNAISIPDICKDLKINNTNVFVMTDDYFAVEEVKNSLPNCKIFTMTQIESKGSYENELQNAEPTLKIKQGEKLFTEIEVFHNAEKGWVDVRSNIGRFLKMRDPDKMHLYPVDTVIRLDKVIAPYDSF
jgi:hypothetical protein